jgi:5-formyltetrahydrofolate cyclo-ligase
MDGPSKDTLREQALFHRERIDPFSEDFEHAITLFYESLKPRAGQVVALYWPKGREFDTRGLLEQLLKDGFTCALPVMVKGSKVLEFRTWKEGEPLAVNRFDIYEPTEGATVRPDILVVPLLAFDRRGHRLGYGGGYYDATIASLRAAAPVLTAGFCYAQQAVLFNLPVDAHDMALDWVITPVRAHSFVKKNA